MITCILSAKKQKGITEVGGSKELKTSEVNDLSKWVRLEK